MLPCLSFACVVSLTIASESLASNDNEATTPPAVENDTSSDGSLSDVFSQESESGPYVVQVSILRKDPVWDDVMSYVEKAKSVAATDTTNWPGSTVYIDFDPRADSEQDESDNNGLNGLQVSVSRALGLDTTKEFFSKWMSPCSRHESEKYVFSG